MKSKEFFDLVEVSRAPVIRQALNEHATILFLQDAIVEQRQQAAVVQ
jgi:hypothetical protein